MEKIKRRYILLEKEISCWKEFSSWNPAFQVWCLPSGKQVASRVELTSTSPGLYLML